MFPNVGWGELVLIALVVLMVFGPKRLPEMARSLGQALRNFQRESSKAIDQLREATEEEARAPGPIAVDDGSRVRPPYEDT